MKPSRALLDAIDYAALYFRETGEHQRVIEGPIGAYTRQDYTKAVPARARTKWTTYELAVDYGD